VRVVFRGQDADPVKSIIDGQTQFLYATMNEHERVVGVLLEGEEANLINQIIAAEYQS